MEEVFGFQQLVQNKIKQILRKDKNIWKETIKQYVPKNKNQEKVLLLYINDIMRIETELLEYFKIFLRKHEFEEKSHLIQLNCRQLALLEILIEHLENKSNNDST